MFRRTYDEEEGEGGNYCEFRKTDIRKKVFIQGRGEDGKSQGLRNTYLRHRGLKALATA